MTLIACAARALCIASFVQLGGCDHNGSDVASTTTTTSAAIRLSNDMVIDEMVNARCMREILCNNVGDARVWGTLYACMNDERDIVHDEISTHRCPHGIAASALSDCTDAIEREACTSPSLPRACSKTYLCL